MNKYSKYITYILLLLVVLVQLYGMFLPFTGDAGKYAAISKNIYQNREFWDLSIHGSPYYQKPPFMMWLSSAAYFIFGTVNNFTTRLFPVIFTLLLLYSTYQLGAYFYSEKIGKLAALMVGTTQMFFLYNTDLHTDVILATCTTTAIWQLAVYIDKRKWYHFVIGFVFIGLAMLTKGPIGLAVPVFAIGAHLLLSRNYKMIFRLEWLAGIAIILLMLYPHFKVLYHHFGWEGPKFFLWTNNAGRISGTYKGNNTDPFFYIYNLTVFTIPWALFFMGGLIKKIISIPKSIRAKNVEYYTIGGALILIFILSFAKTKSPNYFYPAIPLLAILAANLFNEITKTRNIKLIVIGQNIINGMLWISSLGVLLWMFPVKNSYIWVIIGFMFIFQIFILFNKQSQKAFIINSALVAIIVLNTTLNMNVLPQLFDYQASLHAAKIYNNEANNDATFYTYRYYQFEMFFYAKTNGYKIIDEGHKDDPVYISFDEAIKDKGAWFLANEHSYQQIKESCNKLEKTYSFEHYYLTDINWKFLNPKTRQSVLKKIYLVKTFDE